jgi:hypothetical protein
MPKNLKFPINFNELKELNLEISNYNMTMYVSGFILGETDNHWLFLQSSSGWTGSKCELEWLLKEEVEILDR